MSFTIVNYGDVIYMTVGQLILAGSAYCGDPFYPSANTVTLQANPNPPSPPVQPDSFQIRDSSGAIPAGNPPVYYGDEITIYNTTSQQFWKQSHDICLLDTDASEPITPFTLQSQNNDPPAPVQAAPWGSPTPAEGVVLYQDATDSGKNGDTLTISNNVSLFGTGGGLIVSTASTDTTAILSLWSTSAAFGGSGPCYRCIPPTSSEAIFQNQPWQQSSLVAGNRSCQQMNPWILGLVILLIFTFLILLFAVRPK